jgi:hypothetical protein
MNRERVIIHRANAVANKRPVEVVPPVIAKGYHKLEIDITVTGPLSFKFCHVSQQQAAPLTFRFDSQLFRWLATLDVSLWIADIKYPYGDVPPTNILSNIFEALGQRVVFAAAQPDLLTAAHELGARTGQIFRDHIPSQLPFEPDFFIYDEGEKRPLHKSIIYCFSQDSAERYLADGAAYVLLDLPVAEQS